MRCAGVSHAALQQAAQAVPLRLATVATHEKTGQQVAVKILNRNKIHKGGMGEKVRREILNLMKLKHPHIIRL